jgi:hypothetical protein
MLRISTYTYNRAYVIQVFVRRLSAAQLEGLSSSGVALLFLRRRIDRDLAWSQLVLYRIFHKSCTGKRER